MNMSTTVLGFRPPDARWWALKEVWDSCAAADVEPPRAVVEFFGFAPPDTSGVDINIQAAVEQWSTDSSSGFVVDLSKLPPDIRFLRFQNSW